MTESMEAGKCWRSTWELHPDLQAERDRREGERGEGETGPSGMAFWNLKLHSQWHSSSNKAVPNPSNLFKQCHSLMTKFSNAWAYGGRHSYSNHHIEGWLLGLFALNYVMHSVAEMFTEWIFKLTGSNPGLMTYPCPPSTWEAKARLLLWVGDQPSLHSKLKVSLSYRKQTHKQTTNKQTPSVVVVVHSSLIQQW